MKAKPVPRAQARKVLIILHQEHSTPGRVGQLMRRHGYDLDIRRPCLGDELPVTMRDHAGAVIFGGPMSANDNHDYVTREIDWIKVPLKEDKPFFGICLGAQMLVRQLGGRVYTHADGHAEIGYYPIIPNSEADRLCGEKFPRHVYHWHRDGFDLPAGATELASGGEFGDFPVQALSVGAKAFGIQFHPEVTYAMMCRWTTRAADRMGAPGAFAREHHLEGWHVHDAPVARWIEAFLPVWADGAAG